MTCVKANVLLKITEQQLHARNSHSSYFKSIRIRPCVFKNKRLQTKMLQEG